MTKHLADQIQALLDEKKELERLLNLAHTTVSWADQCYANGIKLAAGGKHYPPKRDAYMRARVEYYAKRRPLSVIDTGGCSCQCLGKNPDGVYVWDNDPNCMYHRAAELQPWNHRIAWNCPTYYDGCNCEGGPYFDEVG